MSVVTDDPMGDMIIERLSRCTLPVKVGGRFGTAFLYNELVESTPDADRVREWVVTADNWDELLDGIRQFQESPDVPHPHLN